MAKRPQCPMANDQGREFALDAAEHIIGMMKRGNAESDCLSEGADVILEAAEKIAAARNEE